MGAAVDQVLSEIHSYLRKPDGKVKVDFSICYSVEDIPDPVDCLVTGAGDFFGDDYLVRSEVTEFPVVTSRGFSVLLDEAHGFRQRVDRDVAERSPQTEPVVRVPVRKVQPFDRLAKAVCVVPECPCIRHEKLPIDENQLVLGFDNMRSVRNIAVREG